MNWCNVDNGGQIDLLCRNLIFDIDHDAHQMETLYDHKRFLLSGLIDAGFESFTIFGATMVSQYPIPVVRLEPTSLVLGHKDITWDAISSVVDLCSGFGGFTQGILPSGFHTAMAVDQNEAMVQLFSKASNAPGIVGDVGDKSVLHEIWKTSLGACTLTGGFSCQPFSSLGDRLSSADTRSACLTKLLFAAFYLRSQVLVLECVAPAAQDPFVRSELEYFCTLTGFHCTQKTMKLDNVWPCKRHRAWWVLTSPAIGPVNVPEFQCQFAVPTIERLIPCITPWDIDDERALALSEAEFHAFGGKDENFAQYLLNAKGKSPCALHAWGNQLTACPCGCRPCALSSRRLAEKGLFGLLVHSAPDSEGKSLLRHIHPNEALALNGMDPVLDFGPNPRLALSAVGQLASPLQVHWLMTAIGIHLDSLRGITPQYDHETQLHAYMSWLIARCNLVWSSDECDLEDKFSKLVAYWKPVEHLSLEELMYPPRWAGRIDGPVTIAAVLDTLFSQKPQHHDIPPALTLETLQDDETPWFDSPAAVPAPGVVIGIAAEYCTVIFDDEHQAPIRLAPTVGTTLENLIAAQVKLIGGPLEHVCLDDQGCIVPLSTQLQAGQLIFVKSHPGLTDGTPGDVTATRMDVDVSPTAEWTQPIAQHEMLKPSIYDIGECSVLNMNDQVPWLCADPLLGLKDDQFLALTAPQVATPQQLWSVRHQFLRVKDRIDILNNQGAMFSDDEIRFHLFSLGQMFVDLQLRFSKDPIKQLVTIDPILTAAWMQDRGFDCEAWGRDHGFIHLKSIPVATVFHLDGHWIPVAMHPNGDSLRVFVWDADGRDHMKVNQIIEKLGLSMGFISVLIQRDRRLFLTTDLCGTLAISYLHSTFLQTQLPDTHDETVQCFHMLREQFLASFSSCDIARRPWIWGRGDQQNCNRPASSSDLIEQDMPLPVTLSRDQRLQMIAEHHDAVADDEIRFHVQHIIDRHAEIAAARGVASPARFVAFEPLVFTCWESIGRTISERWCERHPEIRAEGVQVLTAFHLDNHWFPFWWAPSGQTITFHTIDHETIDAHRFRDTCACIGLQLGFSHFSLHVFPQGMPAHSLCGAQAMMFLAQVVHGAVMPDTVQDLRTIHVNMRAEFVADLYSKFEVPAPVLWGNGLCHRESGPLPKLPWMCPLAAHVSSDEPQFCDPANHESGASLVLHEIDWQIVRNLLVWHHPEVQTVQTEQPDHDCSLETPNQIACSSLAMDAVEITHHVSRLQQFVPKNHSRCDLPLIQVLPCLTELASFMHDFVCSRQQVMIHVVLVHRHWVPCVGVKSQCAVRVFVPDIVAHDVQDALSAIPACHVTPVAGDGAHNLCGARVIDVVHFLLAGEPLADSIEELECRHQQLRCRFALMNRSDFVTGFAGFGPQGSLQKDLAAELTKHGVPPELAESRANAAIKSIGSEQVLTALKHKQPWRQLKTLGNNHKFKFVLPSELAQVAETGSTKAKGKGKGKPVSASMIELDPNKLQVLDGVFQSQGRIISQISPKQIGPVSAGVALMTLAEAEPYLRAAKTVSTEPLAMVILHKQDTDIQSTLPCTKITVPCRCTVDNEPVLAEASLVQIGSGFIEKHSGSDLVELETLDVVTLKYLVYKDEIPCSWEDFCKAPIKFLVNTFPLLSRCTADGCKCAMWHNHEGLVLKDPILDVWRRQHLRFGFKPAPAGKADMFSVCLRVPAQLLDGLLATSGTAGAYCEPRTADGTEILHQYTVIWVPKLSVQELMHLKQTNPAIIGIARVGERRGVRALSDQAAAIHKLVRPDTVYLPQGQKTLFLAGPFPFGSDRAAICRALRKAGWECRPLQPSTPFPGRGSMWVVQAVEAPTNNIIATSHGEVVITKHQHEPTGKTQMSTPVASVATLALCGTGNNVGPDTDPWSIRDPWGGYRPNAQGAAVDSSQSIQQLEMRVQNAVLSKLPAAPMEDDLPDRMCMLEDQVQQLIAKHHGLEGQFHEFSAQQGQQLTSMQAQLNAQGQQLHGHMENQSQAIQSMFAQQMEQIRGLLSKRPREEHE